MLAADFVQLCGEGAYCIGLPGQHLDWVFEAADRLLCFDAAVLPECRLQFMEQGVRYELYSSSDGLRLETNGMALCESEQVREYLEQTGLLVGLRGHLLRLERADGILSGAESCIPSEKLQRFLHRLQSCEELPQARREQLLRIADGENALGVRFAEEAGRQQKEKLLVMAERHFEQLTVCHYRLKSAENGAQIWDMYTGGASDYAVQTPEVRLYAAVSLALAQQEFVSGMRAFPYILQAGMFSDAGERAFLTVRSYFYRLAKSSGTMG